MISTNPPSPVPVVAYTWRSIPTNIAVPRLTAPLELGTLQPPACCGAVNLTPRYGYQELFLRYMRGAVMRASSTDWVAANLFNGQRHQELPTDLCTPNHPSSMPLLTPVDIRSFRTREIQLALCPLGVPLPVKQVFPFVFTYNVSDPYTGRGAPLYILTPQQQQWPKKSRQVNPGKGAEQHEKLLCTCRARANRCKGAEREWVRNRVWNGRDTNSPRQRCGTHLRRVFPAKVLQPYPEEAAWEEYDIIIVGSGIGGGILANDLYDTNSRLGKNAKRILLLERGGLVFHSHCLNTARPAGLANDRGQQNDTFFKQFKRQYLFEPKLEKEDAEIPGDPKRDPKQQDPWSGGAIVLRDKYHSQVYQDLREQYYDKAERLMLVSLPTTRRAHQHVMDRLTSKCQEVEPSVQWQWGRIASEFKDDRNFDFAEGAYSTIDKILEIAMSRPKTDVQSRSGDDVFTEHKYFKTVLNADVRSLNFDTNGAVTGVNVKAANGENTTINVRNPGKGSKTESSYYARGAYILLLSYFRSDHTKAKIQDEKYNALHLTDHNILFFQASFRYTNPALREELGAMKLQTYAKIDNQIVLFNMSIDASSFLPRGKSPDPKLPKFIFVIMLQDELVKDNSIVLENDEPKIRLNRRNMPLSEEKMRKFILAAMKALVGSAGLEFVDFEDLKADSKFNDVNDKKFLKKIDIGYLPLGVWRTNSERCPWLASLNRTLYVCDLSCFPHSPAANPTLTLAALAIRLSRHLNERLRVKVQDNTRVYTVNQTSAKVRVFLSYQKPRGKSGNAEEAVVLAPGQEYSWQREANVPQGLFIYRLDMSSQEEKFLDRPVVLVAHPGKVTPILYD
ncbi:GMC oxidoreductase [Rhizoctonia solani]|uniref:GMC oxidoreductase n=1 Tax=Rhizoctonia solani TaxID=456999 RepID=A0A8H7I3X8_9AGAM|nr:GMC oxidoreductase [Rhizoctonia solani]